MNIQQAIRLLDPETTAGALAEIEYYAGFTGKKAMIHAIEDACEIACIAMRLQLPKGKIKEYGKPPRCPRCECSLLNIANYCYNCGQCVKERD